MKVYEVEKVFYAYFEKAVIEGISFDIAEREFFGIIGPNGAGKSTLLRILSRVLTANQGQVRLLEKPLDSYHPKELARLVAFIPQETHFGLEFTVEEIVKMGRYPYLPFLAMGSDQDVEITGEAMNLANVSDLRTRFVNSLSSGERQRVIIARALAQRPKILLLDEPTSHLDLKHQFEIMELLKRLNSQGMTIVLVSHDLNLASLYCTRIMLLKKGKIEAIDLPEKIVSRDWLARVYDIQPEIITHPKRGKPQIMLP